MSKTDFSRRSFLLSTGSAAVAGLAMPAFAQTTSAVNAESYSGETRVVRRNVSSFRSLRWQPYFSNLRNGAILVDIDSRALHMWTEDGGYNLYPSSVPLSEDLTRRGRTSVVRKVDGPTWSPTPAMKKRNPEWPDFVPAGPDNPLGTHALYLGWTYYRIHGTHDTRKIGRKSSNGCIGLFNEHIAEVFAKARIGTQVLLI
ncbi:L,D-transpeptidase [Litoreibacter arenae]|uniref:ErfK/YbiS/YcfS/YnhG family protein/Tat domain protein n=1 Tax=Litoreibacter arenae DSM 19593 TaxID=1123360 RepID=S9Q8K9_9RHOB|nr:L,D-transpeptidase [Litoreibacter arenae]EPX77701.1 ErfK/YbiS/YcfS/YnhG family protein/Tat domain protein [Litoreibacter arenae DSM 19593]